MNSAAVIGIVIVAVVGGIVIFYFQSYDKASDIANIDPLQAIQDTKQTLTDCVMTTYGTGNADVKCPDREDVFHLYRDVPLKAAEVQDVVLTIVGDTYNVGFETPLGIDVNYDLINPIYENEIYQELGKNLEGITNPLAEIGEQFGSITESMRGTPLMIENIISEHTEGLPILNPTTQHDNVSNEENIIQSEKIYSNLELKQIALDDINKYRTDNGLSKVFMGTAVSPQLYAEELFEEGCIHHISNDGDGPMLRYKNNGDTMFMVFENLAGGYGGDPEKAILSANHDMMFDDAHANWGHRDNILNPNHRTVSIGIAYDDGQLVMVQDFEQPLPPGYSYHPSSFEKREVDAKSCW